MTRNGLIAIWFVLLLIGGTGHAHGLDPRKRLTQNRHSTWRIQDGFFPSNPSWVSQTADGYLWVGGPSSGAFRFDGVRFVPWSAASTSSGTYLFLPEKGGGFWIGDVHGISQVRGNLIVSHFNLDASPSRMVEDGDGSLWVLTLNHAGSSGPLCHATDREVRCFGKADVFERSPSEPKTGHAHIVRAQRSARQFIAIKVGIGRHSEHVVARNIFPVKTQRDDGVLSAVSLTTMLSERRKNMRPVKV
jgi:hypothetical protein